MARQQLTAQLQVQCVDIIGTRSEKVQAPSDHACQSCWWVGKGAEIVHRVFSVTSPRDRQTKLRTNTLPEAWKTPPLCTHSTMLVAYEMTANRVFLSRIFVHLIIVLAYIKYHGGCPKALGFLCSKCHGIIDSSTTNFANSITGYECVPHHFVYTTLARLLLA